MRYFKLLYVFQSSPSVPSPQVRPPQAFVCAWKLHFAQSDAFKFWYGLYHFFPVKGVPPIIVMCTQKKYCHIAIANITVNRRRKKREICLVIKLVVFIR